MKQDKKESFINGPLLPRGNEEKLTPMEEKKADALEMAKKAHEKRKEKA